MSLRALRGLRAQLLLWTILPFAVLLIVLAAAGILSHRRAMRQMVEERDRSLVLVEAGRLSRQIEGLRNTVVRIAGDPGFHADRNLAVETARAHAQTLEQEQRGALVVWEDPDVMIYRPAGVDDWFDRPDVQQIRAQARATDQPLIVESAVPGQSPLLVAITSIPRVGPVGARRWLMAAFPIESLDLAASSDVVRAGQRGVTYLLSGRGEVLHHADPARLELPPPTADQLRSLDGDDSGVGHIETADHSLVATYAVVEPLGWTLVLEEPLNDLIPPLLRSVDVLPLLLLVVTVMALLGLYFSVRWVIWPLQQLDRRAGQVAWGDFDAVNEPVGGVQEIEDLRRTLVQMADRLRAYQSGMRDYLAAVTNAQEEERRRLARELDDDTTQSLIGLRQRVEMTEKALARDPGRVPERLIQLREMIDETLVSLQRYVRNLRPPYLEDLGFVPSLEAMAGDIEAQHGLAVRLQVLGEASRLPSDLELAAFRIAQEGLNNVVQHAQATAALLTIGFDKEGLTLRLEDNGVGFVPPEQPHELAASGHFDLMGMRERALLYGGHLSLRSAPGAGTTLVAWLPFPATEGGGR